MFKQHTCFFCIKQCVALVDFYAPLFFSEVATIQPGEFCHKVNLCQNIAYIGLKVQDDSCEFCQDTVSTLLEKLKETDTKVNHLMFLLLQLSVALWGEILLHLSGCEETFSLVFTFIRLSSTTKLWWLLHTWITSTVLKWLYGYFDCKLDFLLWFQSNQKGILL